MLRWIAEKINIINAVENDTQANIIGKKNSDESNSPNDPIDEGWENLDLSDETTTLLGHSCNQVDSESKHPEAKTENDANEKMTVVDKLQNLVESSDTQTVASVMTTATEAMPGQELLNESHTASTAHIHALIQSPISSATSEELIEAAQSIEPALSDEIRRNVSLIQRRTTIFEENKTPADERNDNESDDVFLCQEILRCLRIDHCLAYLFMPRVNIPPIHYKTSGIVLHL